MLAPSEFTVGALRDAKGLTLFLPRSKYEEPILVSTAGESTVAAFLGEKYQFEAFECSTADNWKGLVIADIGVEVNETSAFDTEREYVSYGALVREGDHLSLAVRMQDNHRIYRLHLIPLMTGLALCRERVSAGFRRWQIVLGTGEQKRVLQNFSIEPTDSTPR